VLLPCFREFFLCAENWQLLSERNDNNDIPVSSVAQQALNSKLADVPLTPITDVDSVYVLASALNVTEDDKQIPCSQGIENYISMDIIITTRRVPYTW
jgi:hypothetical protein